jgi:hypothetical protein
MKYELVDIDSASEFVVANRKYCKGDSSGVPKAVGRGNGGREAVQERNDYPEEEELEILEGRIR